MFPTSSINNRSDGIFGKPELRCHGLPAFAGSNKLSDFTYLIFRELGSRIFSALSRSAFARRVLHVGGLISKKQVVRTATSGSIALVQNPKAAWDWSVMKRVGIAVRGCFLLVSPKRPMTKIPTVPLPYPAISKVRAMIGDWSVLINKTPKPLILSRSKFIVGWIAARASLTQPIKTPLVWEVPVGVVVGEEVSANAFVIQPRLASAAFFGDSSKPRPAFIWAKRLIHLFPEFNWSSFWSSHKLPQYNPVPPQYARTFIV